MVASLYLRLGKTVSKKENETSSSSLERERDMEMIL